MKRHFYIHIMNGVIGANSSWGDRYQCQMWYFHPCLIMGLVFFPYLFQVEQFYFISNMSKSYIMGRKKNFSSELCPVRTQIIWCYLAFYRKKNLWLGCFIFFVCLICPIWSWYIHQKRWQPIVQSTCMW